MSAGALLGSLERELREMWTAGVPGELPKARACTMNLVVVAGSPELADRYTPVVDDVTQSIPARAIVVALDADARRDALEGDATAVCAPGESQIICSERIRLTARGSMCARVASAVEALRVAEMPTVLVWLGRVHVTDPVFVDLAEEAQRIVLDTEYTSLGSLLHLAHWARQDPARPPVADLAWTRLAVWQEMCARFFDPPELREHATRVSRLTIRQACEPGARLGSEGALLLGWMATRLGWVPARLGGTLRFRRADGGTALVQLAAVARPEGVAPAALAGVAIEAEHGGVRLQGSVERQLATAIADDGRETDVLAWKLQAGTTVLDQTVRLRSNRGARLLERTLHRPPADPALAEAVAFAEEVMQDDLVCT